MTPNPAELEQILADWQEFARTKVFAFRGVSEAAYALFAPEYFRAIAARSHLHVIRNGDESGPIVAVLLVEQIPDSDTVVVHWAWTHRDHRNTGVQRLLWEKTGLFNAHIFISHLTVVSEKLCEKYGWLFNPFTLYKGAAIESRKDTPDQHDADTGEPGTNARG